MSENMWLEVCRLGKLFVTAIKWADIGTITRVYSDVSPQVKIQRKSLSTTFESTLKSFKETGYSSCLNTIRISHSRKKKFTWKGFSPVCTNWCLFSLLLSTKALPHSAQTCTLGPWVCKCFLIAELSLNIFVHPYVRNMILILVANNKNSKTQTWAREQDIPFQNCCQWINMVQTLCGHGTVLGTSSLAFRGRILEKKHTRNYALFW